MMRCWHDEMLTCWHVDMMTWWLGVERNRKQEFGSFQEVLDLVPATFSPTCSAGPLFVLTSCFIYNVTLSGRTAFILGYLVLTEICKQKTETITSVNQNYHQVSWFEFGKVKLANKKVKLNNKFLNSILDSWNIIRKKLSSNLLELPKDKAEAWGNENHLVRLHLQTIPTG